MKVCRVLISIAFLSALSGCQPEAKHIALGTLERDRILLSATANETIRHIWVHEGQPVQVGDALIQLNDRKARALLEQRQAELAKAQASLNKLLSGTRDEQVAAARAELNVAQAESNNATLAYQRSSELFRKKAIGKADLDAAKSQLEAKSAAVSAQQARLKELQNGARPQDIQAAQADVANALAAVTWQQQVLSDLTIKASHDGLVDSLPWHEGERVSTGTQLISLLSNERLYARVYLPAQALNQVHQGSQVDVYVDGIAAPFSGQILNIRATPAFTPFYALNEKDRDRLMYLTDVLLKDADSLTTGMSLEVRIP